MQPRTYVKIRDDSLCKSEHSARARIAGVLDWNSSESAASQFPRGMKYDPAAFTGSVVVVAGEVVHDGKDTSAKQADRPFLIAAVARRADRRQDEEQIRRVSVWYTFKWQTSIGNWIRVRACARQLLARVKFHYVLTLYKRGAIVPVQVSQCAGSTMNPATRTAPLSLINLITLSQFPRQRCDRLAIVAWLLNRAGSALALPPSFSLRSVARASAPVTRFPRR